MTGLPDAHLAIDPGPLARPIPIGHYSIASLVPDIDALDSQDVDLESNYLESYSLEGASVQDVGLGSAAEHAPSQLAGEGSPVRSRPTSSSRRTCSRNTTGRSQDRADCSRNTTGRSQDAFPLGSLRLLSERVAKYEQDLSPRSLGSSVAEVVTFKGCEDLRRGTTLDKVMRCGGRIFNSSKGSISTFGFSEPVQEFDAFLSHNWVVSRQRKFASLAVHFNFLPAIGVTCVAMVVTTALTIAGLLPTYDVSWSQYPRGMTCRFVCAPVFLTALFHAHRLSRKTVFLDVTCIDQVDLNLQTRGIEKIGAFMRHSASMVAIYSDVYFKKLWTVYEVANFLALHPLEHMHVIPTVVPLVLVVGVVLDYIAVISTMTLEWIWYDFYYAQRLSALGSGFFFIVALRSWGREKAAMRAQLEDFSLSKCACEKESDRALVYGNIASLMRAARAAGKHASEEEALAAFDEVVRRGLSKLVIASMGSYGLKWRHMLPLCFLMLGTTALDKLAAVPAGMPLQEVLVDVLWYAVLVCFHTPLVIVLWACTASARLDLEGVREVLFVFCAVLPGIGFGWTGAAVLDVLVNWGYSSTAGLLALIAFLVVNAAITFVVFRFSPCA